MSGLELGRGADVEDPRRVLLKAGAQRGDVDDAGRRGSGHGSSSESSSGVAARPVAVPRARADEGVMWCGSAAAAPPVTYRWIVHPPPGSEIPYGYPQWRYNTLGDIQRRGLASFRNGCGRLRGALPCVLCRVVRRGG